MKKIYSCIITVFFLIITSASTIAASAESSYNYTCDYIYNMLETKAEKNFYNDLYESCEIVHNSESNYKETPAVKNKDRLAHDRILEIIHLFMYDHPQYFWTDNTTTYSSLSGYSILILEDFQNGEARQYAKTHIEKMMQNYIDGALQHESDHDRLEYLHDALLTNVSYELGDWDQTIASVFLEGKTVCAGYSKAFSLLCNAVGIDAISATSCSHAWNIVKLDGFWYLVDVTHDNSPYEYQHFLISDAKMHEIDISSGVTYQVTLTTDSGTEMYEFYVHDIDYLTYINYYDDFPECDFCYDDLTSYIPTNIAGDANSDGYVNVRDCSYIAMMLARNSGSLLPSYADYNKDENVNVRDAAAIAAALASGNI